MDTFTKTDSAIHSALTSLSDEEQMFREAVGDFATSQIALVLPAVLARVIVSSEEERVRNLSSESIGDVHISHEANNRRTGDDPRF